MIMIMIFIISLLLLFVVVYYYSLICMCPMENRQYQAKLRYSPNKCTIISTVRSKIVRSNMLT